MYFHSICIFFFFFKQKTAYEMRISDWSSDVCSSDLRRRDGSGDVVGLIGALSLSAALALATSQPSAPPTRTFTITGRVVYSSGQIGRASCRERVCKYV